MAVADRVRGAEHGRELPRHRDDREGQQGDAGRRARGARGVHRHRRRRAGAGQGPRLRPHRRSTTRTRSPGRWSSARSRSRCCRSSGFDGISTLAEENKEAARSIGRSMVAALLLAGVLFIVQTWVAALLVPDPDTLISKGDPGGTAFYDAAAVAGGPGCPSSPRWRPRSPGASPTRWSRRPPRPGCSTRWPATGSCRRSWRASTRRKGVPTNATLLVAVVSLVVGLCSTSRDDGIARLSTLVNFGALTAFLALHVSVVVALRRARGSRAGGRTWSRP